MLSVMRASGAVRLAKSTVRSFAAVQNSVLKKWIDEQKSLLEPTNVVLVSGSVAERAQLEKLLVANGTMEPLNEKLRPHSFLARTDPADVARSEQATFICSNKEADAGPTNNWIAPADMRKTISTGFKGAMRGRTMYVIPYSMGPVGGPLSRIGVQVTDSPFVVLNMGIMTRMGDAVLETLGNSDNFVRCVHSVGRPLGPGQKDVPWPCNIPERKIVHFPESREIWSFGSGYGGNSLLGKKCFALRIASVLARDEKWFAEHMLILALTNPAGKKYHVVAAFPSACGKTNLAMLTPTLPGWKVECVGDDISWMRFGKDGRLYALNPEAGFFGVAPGTSMKTNPSAMKSITHDTIFTNVARTKEGDVWWEDMSPRPEGLTTWLNEPYDPSKPEKKAAHPNSRFTVAARQCPVISPDFENPQGVPIDAIIFGGRRPHTVPLVYESFSWQHGVFVGSSVASETTAAADGAAGQLRFDPFAMLPFCGYNMGDYFNHWLEMGKGKGNKNPRIFHVNWFRQEKGKFLWPGFGDNSRVLKWIVDRVDGAENAVKTPVGFVPSEGAINTEGLNVTPETMKELLHVDKKKWLEETKAIEAFQSKFGTHLPAGIKEELANLRARLSA